ncbi:MAG: hypothetical protein KF870_10965 [Leadbetterella sp.]|nr:hypothetical protein [Leadbetterella sp.]
MKTIILFVLTCLAVSALRAQIPVVHLNDTVNIVEIPVGVTEIRFTGFIRQDFELLVYKKGPGNLPRDIIGPRLHQLKSDQTVPLPGDRVLFSVILPSPAVMRVRYLDSPLPPGPLRVNSGSAATGAGNQSLAASMIPYQDAIKILELKGKPEDAQKILWGYFPTHIPSRTCCNAYLKEAGFSMLYSANKGAAALSEPTINAQAAAGVFSPTMVADVLGTFIAKRFKEEINAAYLIRFRETLERKDELKRIFPESYLVLSQSDPYNYTTFLQILQEAFHQDLQHIPQNMLDYIRFNKKWFKDLNNDPVLDFLAVTLQFYSGVQAGQEGQYILAELINSQAVQKIQDTRLKAGLNLLSLLAANAYSRSETPLARAEVAKLSASKDLANLYIGLILEKERDRLEATPVTDDKNLYIWMEEKQPEIDSLLVEIGILSKGLSRFKEIEKQITSKKENAETPDHQAQLASLYFNLFETGVNTLKDSYSFVQRVAPNLPKKPTVYLDLTGKTVPVVKYVWMKNYGLALAHGVKLLQSHKLPLLTSKNKGKKDKEPEEIAALQRSIGDSSGISGQLLKYGSFIVTVAKAETSAEMLQALETAALPVGSYRIKRNNYFNLAVNAYGGIFGAREKVFALPGGVSEVKPGFAWGATAPVGISFSWGSPQTAKRLNMDGRSWGGFVSLIDVGTVFAFRMKDQVSTLPELRWSNLLAPGLYLVHGIKNSPLAVSFGAQYGPDLRKIEVESALTDVSAWRLGFSLTADIPLFNLSTKLHKSN